MKFTKGPWEVKTEYGEFEIVSGKEIIANSHKCTQRGLCNEEINDDAFANACLISAAPEMYEVLTELLPAVKSFGGTYWVNKIEAALNKANGN